MQDHHPAKDAEYRRRTDHFEQGGNGSGNDGRQQPVGSDTQRLSLRPQVIGKYFGNKYPNNRSLPHGVRRNKSKQRDGDDDARYASSKTVSHYPERQDVPNGTQQNQLTPPHSVDEQHADDGKNQVGNTQSDATQLPGFGFQSRQTKDPVGVVEQRVDARELVEKGNGKGEESGKLIFGLEDVFPRPGGVPFPSYFTDNCFGAFGWIDPVENYPCPGFVVSVQQQPAWTFGHQQHQQGVQRRRNGFHPNLIAPGVDGNI